MEFKDKLKNLRAEKGVTQTTLGEEIHVSRSAIAKWEAGLGLPSEDSMLALCVYFGVDRAELFNDRRTEELLVGKNEKIKKHKNIIIKLLVAFIVAVLSFGAFTAYLMVEKYERMLCVEQLKSIVPTVTKMQFENPYTNLEREAPFEDGRYVLSDTEWVKVFFEIKVDQRACEDWYSFHPKVDGFYTFAVEEESFRYVKETDGVFKIFCVSVYVRAMEKGEQLFTLSEFVFFHTIDGEGYEKVCRIEAKSLPVVVKDE